MSADKRFAKHAGWSAGARSAFALTVEYVLERPGSDLLAVLGFLEAGWIPPSGTVVTILAEGNDPVTARVAGGPAFDVRPPVVGLLLRGVRAVDVPKGARLTAISAARKPVPVASMA